MKITKLKNASRKKTPATPPIPWAYETHELPGRTVTVVTVYTPANAVGLIRGHQGVSIRNPHDCPLASDGIKHALGRAMERAKLPKAKRRLVWQDFLARFPVPTPTPSRDLIRGAK